MSILPSRAKLYKRVYRLNRALTEVVRQCEWLEKVEVLSNQSLKSCRLTAQEIQAIANTALTASLHDWEMEDVGHLRELRKGFEREVVDADADLLTAQQLKKKALAADKRR
jgi:hypothetical protein